MKGFSSTLCAGLILVAFASTAASAKLTRTGGASTQFKAAGPSGLNFVGATTGMTLVDDGTTVKVTVPLNNLSTGLAFRDKMTKMALEVAKYPTASLAVSRKTLKFLSTHGSASGAATGSLTIYGHTKSVRFHYRAKLAGTTYKISGTASIDVDDFGVKRPSYLGVTIKPTVQLTTSFSAIDE